MSEARDPMERDLELIKLELDQDGSPVSIEPRGWFVCIVPGLVKQWWHPFVHERHKHVFAMRPAGPGQWTLFEPWWRHCTTRTAACSRRAMRSTRMETVPGGTTSIHCHS